MSPAAGAGERGGGGLSGLAWLALQHALGHRFQTALLVLCLAVSAFLPLAGRGLMDRYERDLRARAASTPLVLGARGSRVDLFLAGLYFHVERTPPLTASGLEALDAGRAGIVVPLHAASTVRGRPLVATTPEYFEQRGLAAVRGSLPLKLGDAVLGAAVARELGLGPGDSVFSDPKELYDISRPAALRMPVVGVLAATGGPDDGAVFTGLRTARLLEGQLHGHVDVATDLDEAFVLSRGEGSVAISPALIEVNEVTDGNVEAFHGHGDPGDLPLTAALVFPWDAKAGTLLKSRINAEGAAQVVVPTAVLEELLSLVFRVRALFDRLAFVLGATTVVLGALVVALSARLRTKEMHTLDRIGCPRHAKLWLHGFELAFVGLASAVLALFGTALALRLAPDLSTLF